jgi:hypothetical protein
MNIHEKLSAIQSELKAPKNQRNNFGNYNYRSCEDIVEAVKPLLKKYHASLTLGDEIIQIGERYYVKALATIYDTEAEGAYIFTSAFAREEDVKKGMDSAQITGSASSYARKYALNGLFAIDDTKQEPISDPDSPPLQKSVEYTCEECRAVIKAYKTPDGKNVSAERHVKASQGRFGRTLCLDCISKVKGIAED